MVSQAHFEETIRSLEQYMEYRGMALGLRERAKRFYMQKFPQVRITPFKNLLVQNISETR